MGGVGGRRAGVLLLVVIILLSHPGLSIGDEGSIESSSDGLEEVSIEAVDDYESQLHSSISSIGRGGSSGESESIPDPDVTPSSPAQSLSDSDSENATATAVATVYPDISGNLSSTNGSASSNSTAANGTTTASRFLRVKVSCSQFVPEGNLTLEETVGTVEIVNMTHLLHGILVTNPTIKTRSTPSNCTVILFFTHWCPWSAKAAPHFNALPRAFRNIRFAAIDSSVHTAINTYFGILSVPSVVLFYNGKILAKFNDTSFSVNQFADFISTFTDQKPGIRLNVTSIDFVGPIPSATTKGHDWYLYLSWTFIIGCLAYYFSRTLLWARMLEIFQNSWREAEAVSHHFHQD